MLLNGGVEYGALLQVNRLPRLAEGAYALDALHKMAVKVYQSMKMAQALFCSGRSAGNV